MGRLLPPAGIRASVFGWYGGHKVTSKSPFVVRLTLDTPLLTIKLSCVDDLHIYFIIQYSMGSGFCHHLPAFNSETKSSLHQPEKFIRLF